MATVESRLDQLSTDCLSNQAWQTEQKTATAREIHLRGFIEGELRGNLFGQLIIERQLVNGTFTEKVRRARLTSLAVHPHRSWRRQGLGTALYQHFEKEARSFGATKITGTIGSSDLTVSPWLPDFYHKLGFTLTPNLDGFTLEKSLSASSED